MSEKLKDEIQKRTQVTSKLLDMEAKKLAVGELVIERLDSILELLRSAGFKVTKPVAAQQAPAQPSIPPNTVVVQDRATAPPPPAPVQRPCIVCGQEAAFAEAMPDGSQKLYCRPHGQARSREKQEEAVANDLFHGNTGTLYARPKNPNPPTPQKVIIQAQPPPPPPPPGQSAADLLKGPYNGAQPQPHNPIFDNE